MKWTKISDLEGAKERYPIYLLVAEDVYDRERAIIHLGPPTTTLHSPDVQQVMEELGHLSLFEPHRVILIREVPKGLIKPLLAYREHPSTTLILEMANPPSSLYKAIEERGAVLHVQSSSPYELERWVASEHAISPEATKLLIAKVGSEKRRLLQELEKLSLYATSQITEADVEAIVVGFPHQDIWELGKRINERNGKVAIAVWQRLSLMGHHPLSLLPALRSQMRRAQNKQALIALFETELLCKRGLETAAMERLIGGLC